jgi:pimeloyl-ACP methyl ester esterase
VVLLHGWGSSAAVFTDLAHRLGELAEVEVLELPAHGMCHGESFARDAGRLLDWLQARIPAGSVLVGWSLGGTLGLQLALREPHHLAGLVTIATSPCFLRNADWPLGMEGASWEAFRAGLARDPAAQLARFVALQAHGDRRAREVAHALRVAATPASASADELQVALDALAAPDLRTHLATLPTPVLHVLGERDAIVDVRLADEYLRLQPQASVWVVPGAAHAPFLSAAQALTMRIGDFIVARIGSRQPAAARKRDIAASFGRAAPGYEAAASLQRETGAALLAMLAPAAARRVLDLGCGTGHFAVQLAARYADAAIVAVDIAEGMLRHARTGRARSPYRMGVWRCRTVAAGARQHRAGVLEPCTAVVRESAAGLRRDRTRARARRTGGNRDACRRHAVGAACCLARGGRRNSREPFRDGVVTRRGCMRGGIARACAGAAPAPAGVRRCACAGARAAHAGCAQSERRTRRRTCRT